MFYKHWGFKCVAQLLDISEKKKLVVDRILKYCEEC